MRKVRFTSREPPAVHVGDRGKAATALHPQGHVLIHGVRFDARAEFGGIASDAEVVVVTGDHLGLLVREFHAGEKVKLKDHGKRLLISFAERARPEPVVDEATLRKRRAERRPYGLAVGAPLGLLFAGLSLAVTWYRLVEAFEPPLLHVLATVLIFTGILWGVVAFFSIDWILSQVEENLTRVTTPSTFLALLGTSTGAVLAIPSLGLVAGLGIALLGAFLLGTIIPVLFMLAQFHGEE